MPQKNQKILSYISVSKIGQAYDLEKSINLNDYVGHMVVGSIKI